MACHWSAAGSYRPPLLTTAPPCTKPPHTIMRPCTSSQTAVWRVRSTGASIVAVETQVSVRGSYRPPVLVRMLLARVPPHRTMTFPVQTALAVDRPGGALVLDIAGQVSVVGSN